MNIAIIDNYDSFTYNLYQQVAAMGEYVEVFKNDKIKPSHIKKYDRIIISPGPKTPQDSGQSCEIIQQYHKKTPILGVCLGHQCIGHVFGEKIVRAPQAIHGKVSPVYHNHKGLFKGIKSPLNVARYHSLIIKKLPKDFILTAWTADNLIMAIEHDKYPLFGIQFHPESFLTEHGNQLMKNFLYGNY